MALKLRDFGLQQTETRTKGHTDRYALGEMDRASLILLLMLIQNI